MKGVLLVVGRGSAGGRKEIPVFSSRNLTNLFL